MKPAWDQLGDEYASSSSVVIADVDCTVEQDLCGEYDVKGYPTIKYFTSETSEKGDDYTGGRDFDGLKSWVSENLEVKCLLADTTGCTEKEVRSPQPSPRSLPLAGRCRPPCPAPPVSCTFPHSVPHPPRCCAA